MTSPKYKIGDVVLEHGNRFYLVMNIGVKYYTVYCLNPSWGLPRLIENVELEFFDHYSARRIL